MNRPGRTLAESGALVNAWISVVPSVSRIRACFCAWVIGASMWYSPKKSATSSTQSTMSSSPEARS